MLRELLITLYLTFVKVVFLVCKAFPLQRKTTFVMSFPGNIPSLVRYLNEAEPDETIVVIQTKKILDRDLTQKVQHVLPLHHPVHFFRALYHLATSRYVFVDNYYGFLAATDFKPEVMCIQVWHAVGALKMFGLQDLTNRQRYQRALKRFQRVYDRFDTIVVGSESMADIFKQSFAIIDDERFLRTGIPRTDFFFDNMQKKLALQQFKNDFPKTANKKVLLYAPTYREEQLGATNIELELDFHALYEQLKEDYVLLLRLHPAVSNHFNNPYPDFIIDVSNYQSINTLLIGTDILITDYSSIPFEFALLGKPMIFYVYDLEDYAAARGIVSDYETIVPGPIVKTSNELLYVIKEDKFDIKRVQQFAAEWNEYSHGDATEKLIHSLYDITKDREAIREHG